jgi:hypothetical protein
MTQWLSELMEKDNPEFYGFMDWLMWKFRFGWRVLAKIEPIPERDYPGYTVWWHYNSGRRRTVVGKRNRVRGEA